MLSSTLPKPFLAWEGEAPAEPLCIKLGRSLAPPIDFRWFDMGKMFRGVGLALPKEFRRESLAAPLSPQVPQASMNRLNEEEEEQLRTAYHEAGHCVMAILCGAKASIASITSEQEYLHGQVEIHWPSRSSVADQLATVLAGPVAEMIYRSEPLHPGLVPEWSEDWKQAWALARPKSGSDGRCMAMLEQLVAKLYQTLSQDRYWAAVAAVQDLLIAHNEIDHDQIEYEVKALLD